MSAHEDGNLPLAGCADLLGAYRQQESLYARVLELAEQGLQRLKAGGGLEELDELNRRKADLLGELRRTEEAITLEKERCEESGAVETNSAELDAVLANISVLIDQILLAERAIEHWIVQGDLVGPAKV